MSDDIAIKVENVGKTFRLPHEKNNSIKSAFVNFYKSKRTYEKQKALEDVSFEVKKGEFFGIVGRNGSGKSTLLKVLAGIYSPSKGSIHINGKLTPFIELGVGFSPELTGRENVFLNGALLGFSRKEMESMYDDIVEFAELERFMDQKLKNYSSGMQVRLAFSIAIRAQTDILVLDEVLAVGDAAFQQKCNDYFEKQKADRQTVILVTHDMGAIQRFCDRALILEQGVVKEIGDPIRVADTYSEDNFQQAIKKPKGQVADKNIVTVSCSDHDKDKQQVKIEVIYDIKSKAKSYCGISIVKEGLSVAEINTIDKPKTGKKGKYTYTLDTTLFNPGLYEVAATILRSDNKAPITNARQRAKFLVKGFDKHRGGALYIEDKWS